ncbi:hypothetical protein F3Y22_tig00000340pilonHSYRG00125 [Hibiscus syriacus]|uniref:Uncharacterized protein n=1 Tax=Hibiscus syriacus TaxID=106335 RepID=A0A6A3D1C9_HIBSY|nr:hypothetical protein F3Y22_tig00000340pilonHSYRG00125 [Hibiscus syriacus]
MKVINTYNYQHSSPEKDPKYHCGSKQKAEPEKFSGFEVISGRRRSCGHHLGSSKANDIKSLPEGPMMKVVMMTTRVEKLSLKKKGVGSEPELSAWLKLMEIYSCLAKRTRKIIAKTEEA